MAKQSFVSPKGVAVFPHLTTPDTKFKDEGEFHVGVRVSPTDATEYAKAEALVAEIDAFAQEYLKKTLAKTTDPAKRKKIKLCEDMPYRRDEETGDITFNFKMKASGKNKQTGEEWTKRPVLFDKTGKPLADGVKIGGGSVIKVSYGCKPSKDEPFQQFFGWFATTKVGVTVTLRLIAAQILELREYTKTASGYGFENEGADDDETDTDTTEDADETEEGDDDDANDGDF